MVRGGFFPLRWYHPLPCFWWPAVACYWDPGEQYEDILITECLWKFIYPGINTAKTVNILLTQYIYMLTLKRLSTLSGFLFTSDHTPRGLRVTLHLLTTATPSGVVRSEQECRSIWNSVKWNHLYSEFMKYYLCLISFITPSCWVLHMVFYVVNQWREDYSHVMCPSIWNGPDGTHNQAQMHAGSVHFGNFIETS